MDLSRSKETMLEMHLKKRGIRDARVLAAMGQVAREDFIEDAYRDQSYEDRPLPIGELQTISQPYIVAAMAEAAELSARDRVLEVGTGSGYAAAVFAHIAKEVFSIERHGALAKAAARRLDAAGVENVRVQRGDGTLGWPDAAPFDAIIVAASCEGVPSALKAQLADGGRLIIPVGPADRTQRLIKIVRSDEGYRESVVHEAVRFVPLIAEGG